MNADILIIVTTVKAADYLLPLLNAANRVSCKLAVFLTNDGVKLASDNALGSSLSVLSTAVVCTESWSKFMPDKQCPVTSGSQTDLSRLVSDSKKVISL